MEDKLFNGFIKICVGVVYAAGASWVCAKAYASAKKALKSAEEVR